jgi:membrane-associated phospholipid phosphatase
LLYAARLGVAPGGPGAVAALFWLGSTAWAAYALRRPKTRIEAIARNAAEYFGVFVAVTLFGIVASYAVAAQSVGYVDASLSYLDSRLGFDWNAWYAFVAAHPLARIAGRIAYANIYVSPVVLLAWFAYAGEKREARIFIAAFWLAVVLTLVTFVLIPAQGPLAAMWHGPIPYMPSSALYQAELIPQLRSHGLQEIHVEALQGVVCAPSFHAASGVLFIAAGWRAPPLRWPLLVINILMLLATPVEGTHYLVDIILGAAVAIVALVAVRLLVRRFCRAHA